MLLERRRAEGLALRAEAPRDGRPLPLALNDCTGSADLLLYFSAFVPSFCKVKSFKLVLTFVLCDPHISLPVYLPLSSPLYRKCHIHIYKYINK